MILEYAAVALSMAGALLVSSPKRRRRRAGFLVWIASNALFVAWAACIDARAVIIMYLFYSVTSLRGVISNKESRNVES